MKDQNKMDELADVSTPASFNFETYWTLGLRMYLKCYKEHWLRDKDDDGRILILEDESRWEIVVTDRQKTTHWLRVSTIMVEEQKNHSYVLKNMTEAESARANCLGRPSEMARIPKEAA